MYLQQNVVAEHGWHELRNAGLGFAVVHADELKGRGGHPVEQRFAAEFPERRRVEFLAGREALHRALDSAGLPGGPVLCDGPRCTRAECRSAETAVGPDCPADPAEPAGSSGETTWTALPVPFTAATASLTAAWNRAESTVPPLSWTSTTSCAGSVSPACSRMRSARWASPLVNSAAVGVLGSTAPPRTVATTTNSSQSSTAVHLLVALQRPAASASPRLLRTLSP